MNVVKHDGNGAHAPGPAHGRDTAGKRHAKDGHRPGTAENRPMPATLETSVHAGSGSEERTDEELLSAYRQGDRTSFTQLIARYQRELFHFLVRFLGDRAAAEDVFQETFLQVHQSAEQFDTSRRFRPWLFTIAANKARDLIRSQARRPTNPLQASINPGDDDSGEFMDLMSSVDNLPDEGIQKEELQKQVQKTVLGMPQHLREILLL